MVMIRTRPTTTN